MLKVRHYKALKEIKIVGTNKDISLTIISLINELEKRDCFNYNHKEGLINSLYANITNIISPSSDKGGDFSVFVNDTSFSKNTDSRFPSLFIKEEDGGLID